MKIRIASKRRIASLYMVASCNMRWQKAIDAALELTPEERARQDKANKERWDQLHSVMEESLRVAAEPRKWYQVAKKSTGEVVGSYSTLEAANEDIAKAKRQKKAALVLVA